MPKDKTVGAFGHRVELLKDHFADSIVSFVNKSSFSRSAYYTWLELEEPTTEAVGAILSSFSTVNPQWLKTGQGEMLPSSSGDGAETGRPAPPDPEVAGEFEADVFGEAGAADEVTLRAGATEPKKKTVTPARWRRDFGDRVEYGASGYGYWTVRGPSAAPVYFDGEDVPVRLIGPTQDFKPERIYVFRWNGDLYLKRLFQSGAGVYAQSLNPAIRDMSFKPDNGHSFAVLAEVCSSTKQQLFLSLLGSKLEPNR